MMREIKVTYVPERNSFLVRCPFHANDLIQSAPSKRWNKAARGWLLPAMRLNCQFLYDKIKDFAEFDKESADKIREVAKGIKKTVQTHEFPAHYQFKTEPLPFQYAGIKKLYGKRAMAFYMEMGLGKTKTTIDVVGGLVLEGKVNSLLVVARNSLTLNWVDEFEKHYPGQYAIRVHENNKEAYAKWMWANRSVDLRVYVVSTEAMSQGGAIQFAENFLLADTKCAMVMDESHDISNPKSIRSERIVSLARKAEYRIALTGTPIEQGPLNLYMQFEYLDPNIIGIGDYYAFRNRYAIMGGYKVNNRYMSVVGYQNLEELISTVDEYVYQVLKKDVLKELPDKIYEKRYVEMVPEQRKEYDRMRKNKSVKCVDGTETKTNNQLEVVLRLQQIASGYTVVAEKIVSLKEVLECDEPEVPDTRYEAYSLFEDFNESPKMQELLSIINDNKQVPTVIWCKRNFEIQQIMGTLSDMNISCAAIVGSVAKEERHRILEDFKSGEITHLVVNQQTGGTGLNMTTAQLMIYFSNSFSYRERLQSEDRAHRIGQKNAVVYIDIVVKNSVDELVLMSIEEKQSVAEYLQDRFGETTAKWL